MISAAILATVLTWPAVALDCLGGPEVMGHYELTYYVGEMVEDPSCPVDVEYGQRCRLWDTYIGVTTETFIELPEPLVGQVIVYNPDWLVAVDAAGNRSNAPCL